MSIDNDMHQPQRLLPRTLEDVLRAWSLRGSGAALIAASCTIWIAMLTWSANDPSMSLNTAEPAQNLLGPIGAVIADFFFHTLGVSVVFFAVPPVVLGLQLVLGDVVTDLRQRLTLFAIATVGIAGGCSALPISEQWPSALGYGGIIGDFAYSVIAGIATQAAPQAGGALTGICFFAVGFWAFSRAICLDRFNVFNWRLPQRHAATGIGAAARHDPAAGRREPSLPGLALSGLGGLGGLGGMGLARRFRRMKTAETPASERNIQAERDRAFTAEQLQRAATAGDHEAPDAPVWSFDARLSDFEDAANQTSLRSGLQADEPARRPATVHLQSAMHEELQHRAAAHAAHDMADHGARPLDTGASGIAARFAPGQEPDALANRRGGIDDGSSNMDTHQTVLLDDEMAPAAAHMADDLPNVLKRARVEAAELLPASLAARLTDNVAGAVRKAVGERENADNRPPPLTPRRGENLSAARRESRQDETLAQQIEAARQPETPTAAPKVVATGYRRPSLNLLKPQKSTRPSADTSREVLQGRARMLEDVLADFRIKGDIQDVRPGPVITLFELEPSRGTKSARVIALADDVARSMSAVSARIAVVPGRNAIGIELPNTRRETFGLRELIDSQTFLDSDAKLPLVLGKGIGGEPVMTDLARMPHLLVAGTTGSGKSVGVNAMILSLIYRLGPQDCRFLMIDPKMLELSAYNGIPHLLTPVITDSQKAITALSWAVGEMEERYKRMTELGVRGIEAFNTRVKHASRTGEKLGRTVQTGFDPATGEAVFEETTFDAVPLPYIVIVVDEFADLMAVAGKEIEGLVQRLAQMARAAGIHMIMATQRPSVDVVTGTIKANFPTRISYRVASRIDSRTILNEQGGEQLLGQGDMLFLDGTGNVQRVHGPFVSDEEVEGVTNALRGTYPANYVGDILSGYREAESSATPGPAEKPSDLYDQAVEIVLRDQKASTSYLQRRLSIGYNRAADLIDRMENEGLISAADHAGKRDILLAG